MSKLHDAMNTEDGLTYNGGLTNTTSLNKNVDLFSVIASARKNDITPLFYGALGEDQDLAIRILLWSRDVRGGAGERATFRKLFKELIKTNAVVAKNVLRAIPELGRWDDALVAFETTLERDALRLIARALATKDGLCAKWMPRKGAIANKIRSYMRLTPKQYRKALVSLSSTVEQQMCANEWTEINYEQVPSVASARYQAAFRRHDPVGYENFANRLQTGEAKINASVVFPHDVIRSIRNGNAAVVNAQWDALPNYLEGTSERILPVVDVSGSMSVLISGSISAMDVAVGLGLYLSERNNSIFKDQFVTFSRAPAMVKVTGNLITRYNSMIRADWGMNTDIELTFKTILKKAVTAGVPADEMPTKVLILSDMEFDRCTTNADMTMFNSVRKMYEKAGYELPHLVFWNLNGRVGNVPVRADQTGTALISGFSPVMVKSVLGGELSPVKAMLDTVMKERYDLETYCV